MKKIIKITGLLLLCFQAQAQHSTPELDRLFEAAMSKNDTLQLYDIRQQQTAIDIKTTKYNFLPRVGFNATYTRLNDDIVFPENLQQLLMGTQALLAKEKLGIPFNTALPAQVPLQPVSPIQEKNIFKTTATGQWLLFSGGKVYNGVKAYEHQQKAYDHLSEKQKSKIWLDVADVYDKLALVYASDEIITSSENILNEQSRFVEAAIKNGLATPLERKKVQLAQQKLDLKKLENVTNKDILRNKLQQLTGVQKETLRDLKPALMAYTQEDISTIHVRPEIKALDEGIKANDFKRKAELAEYIPKVAAFGQYEFREKDLSMLDPKWYAGVRLQWNLFDGLTAKNNASKIRLEQKALEVQKTAATDLINLARSKYTDDLAISTQKVQLKQASIALTADTYDFVNKQYRNGLTTLTEVLNAVNDLEKEKFEMQQALYEQRKAALQLADINGNLLK